MSSPQSSAENSANFLKTTSNLGSYGSKANVGLSRQERQWMKRIQEALSFDLLNSKYRKLVSPLAHFVTGHCSVATEAAYYLFAKDAGFKPQMKKIGNITHWWLFHPEREVILDVTAPQVDPNFDYKTSRRSQSFQGHGTPSIRALHLMVRVQLMSCKKCKAFLEKTLHQAKNISN